MLTTTMNNSPSMACIWWHRSEKTRTFSWSSKALRHNFAIVVSSRLNPSALPGAVALPRSFSFSQKSGAVALLRPSIVTSGLALRQRRLSAHLDAQIETIARAISSASMAVRHVTKISSLTRPEVAGVLRLALDMKARPADYHDALKRKTLLMLFEKPSLRTRVSLEAGMTSLGGHGIAYMTGDSPIGEKESYEDTGAVLSRMCDAVTARVKSREQVNGLAENATIPIINALDDYAHPMQMLADLQTIVEHKGGDAPDVERALGGKALAFVGDCCNNVTYDLMRAGALMGLDVRVAGPTGEGFDVEPSVLEECAAQVCRGEEGDTTAAARTIISTSHTGVEGGEEGGEH